MTQINGRPAVNLRFLSPDDFPKKGEGVWVEGCDSIQTVTAGEEDLTSGDTNPWAPYLLRLNLLHHWDRRPGAAEPFRPAVNQVDAVVHLTERLQVPAMEPAEA
jgi:hypothetical protein